MQQFALALNSSRTNHKGIETKEVEVTDDIPASNFEKAFPNLR
jgi:hypothetical protein